MHMDMLQERIYRKNAGSQMERPDQARTLTLTVRTPQCGHTVWGTTNLGGTMFSEKPGVFEGLKCHYIL